jgi:repressor LexA
MESPLTPKQKRVLDTLRQYWRMKGYMPSVLELSKLTKSAVGTVHDHLVTLKRKGWIHIDGTSRGIRLAELLIETHNLVTVPLVGTIAAGEPIEAIETPGEPLTLPKSVAKPGAFALRVRGDSMVEDHILNGDVVVVRPQETVANGEIAVALLDDGTATLKRVYREKHRIRLQPANATMKPLYVTHLRIQGRVSAVVRLHGG